MKLLTRTLLSLGSLLIGLAACEKEDPTSPCGTGSGTATPPPCQAPPIERNIVGTWHFDTDAGPDTLRIKGTITFTADRNVIDPDSLLENRIDGYVGLLVAKTYGFKDGLLEVYQYGRNRADLIRLAQTYPYRVRSNACNRIELEIRSGSSELILTR